MSGADKDERLVGRELGDFVVRRKIGAGGFGAVYLAEQARLGRDAVIKVPLQRATQSPEFVARFLREARLASKLDHPYAAHIYAFGSEPDGTLWTAMEFVRGVPLNDFLKQKGPLPVERFLPLFEKICEVVHTAHEQGIVHRDIKPANVMVLTRAGQLLPKLLDLGIAKLDERAPAGGPIPAEAPAPGVAEPPPPELWPSSSNDRLDAHKTRAGKSLGSPAYMSPEQWVDARRADARSDVYALGILAFECLAGRLPFAADSIQRMAAAHAFEPPPPLGGDLPRALDTVIARAMAKKPDDRFSTALDLAAAVADAIGSGAGARIPEFDPFLRDELTAVVPQPLAEALAALDGARNLHQARTAVFAAARVTARLVGTFALAGQLHAHAADPAELLPTTAADAVRRLRHHGLADDEWLSLATTVASAWAERPAAFALPQLIAWCSDPIVAAGRDAVTTLRDVGITVNARLQPSPAAPTPTRIAPETMSLDVRATAGMIRGRHGPDLRATVALPRARAGASDDDAPIDDPSTNTEASADPAPSVITAADELAEALALKTRIEESLAEDEALLAAQLTAMVRALERALRPLRWLGDLHVTVPRGDFGEHWTGVRRPTRAMALMHRPAAAATVIGQPVLLDGDGAVVLPLWPLFQIAPPAPGHPDELFVLDGPAQAGARLVSLPTGFERSSPDVWPALARLVSFDDAQTARAAEKAPYRGLAQFTAGDADLFVGREREAEAFANRLRVTPLLAVVGPSGAGKSSFIQAGVMPLLGETWTRLIVRPGGAPMAHLDAMLVAAGVLPPPDGATPGDRLVGDRLAAALHAWAAAQRTHVLLYIDQFEELFTLCHDPAERDRFVDALLRASLHTDVPVRVVLTVRDDFLLRCQQLEALRDRLVHGLQLLATPTPADLRRILVEPARRVGYTFDDPALPDEMVAATDGMAAALPLLSFTAAQLWDLRDKQAKTITRTAYAGLGGVGGALAQHAERVLAALPEERRGLVRVAFRNLVTAEGTRAILTRAELQQLLGSHADADAVLEALIGARLLAAGGDGGAGDHVEVVHEALLAAWPRLLDWRREDAEGARLRDQLRAAARQWHDRGRPRGLLWRDEALTEFLLWRARQPGPLTDVEHAFGAASEREALRARRLRRAVLATIGAILAVGLVVALVLYRQAEGQRAEAAANAIRARTNEERARTNEERAKDLVVAAHVSQGQRAALAGDLGASLLYFAEARKAGVTGTAVDIPLGSVRRAMNAEEKVYRGHDKKVWSLELLRDGERFVSGGADGNVHLWRRSAPRPLHTWNVEGSVEAIALTADEARLAIMATDGRFMIVDLAEPRAVRLDLRHPERTSFLALSRDGSHAAMVSMSGMVSIVDVARGQLATFTASDRGVGVPAISPDGVLLVLPIFDGTIQLRALADGRLLGVLRGGHSGEPYKAQFSPDGQLLAVAGGDKVVSLWDVRTRRLLGTLAGHTNSIDEVTWSPDGQWFATGARDGTARIWSRDGKLRHVLQGGRGVVYGLSWSSDARRVVGAFGDTVMTWDADLGAPIATFSGQGSSVFRAFEVPSAEAPRRLLSAGSDGTVRAWRVEPALTFTPGARTDVIPRADTCDDNRTLLAYYETSIALRDRAGRVIWQSPATWEVADAWCDARSPRVLVALTSGEVWRLDAPTAAPHRVPLPDAAAATGPRAITLARDGTLILADAERVVAVLGDQVRQFVSPPGDPEPWTRLSWSPAQRYVAAQSARRVVVWEVASGALRVEAVGPGEVVRSVAFDHDEAGVLIVGEDYVVPRYALSSGARETTFTAAAWAWSAVTVGDEVYLGLDDASVARFRRSTGQLLDVLPGFGSDVVYLHAQDGMLWIGAMAGLAVVDLETRATVGKITLPSSIATSTPFGQLTVATRGWDDTVSTWSLTRDTAEVDRLEVEARCRGGGALVDGRLVPGPPDLTACASIAPR